jgi:hypothetical protein
MKMSKKDIWISPRENGWAVQSEGSQRAARVHNTQAQAIQHGRSMAQSNRSELIVQGENGRIREKNSYGSDPRRTKG